MQVTRQRLLALLADGRFHSGEALGGELGMSRAAIWKQISALNELGLDICRVPGRGYRLAQPLELLDAERIRSELSPAARNRLTDLQLYHSIDSTNAQLMRETELPPAAVIACLAEQQTAGRGRRGRPWVSPFGANLYLSLSWPFESLPPDFSALSLAVGVAVHRALTGLGFDAVRLKWPNDLYANNAKLGGILIEMRGEPPGPCRIVAGVGINVVMPAASAVSVDQAWTDLATLVDGEPTSRNCLAAAVLNQWIGALAEFAVSGFAGFHGEWCRADLLAGREVVLLDGARRWQGTAQGVAADGALEVDTDEGLRRFVAGDVSLREAS